jgi:hypothetical protein
MFLDEHLLPPCWWSSVGHERKQTLRQGAIQKARGIKRGLPDVMIWAPEFFLGVELKAAKNTTTDAQDGFAEAMERLGHGYAVVRSVVELGETILRHGIALSLHWRIFAEAHDLALCLAPPPSKPSRKPPTRKPTLAQIKRGNRLSLVGIK